MKKPVILLSPQTVPMEEPFRGEYYRTSCYNMNAVTRAGGLPLLPCHPEPEDAPALMARAEGLFLTGGADVCPSLYGQETLPLCGPTEPRRDQSDYALLNAALTQHKPVLCVCRGFQLGNVRLGGTLWQDLSARPDTGPDHSRSYAWPDYRQGTAHRVHILPDTPLHRLLGRDTLGVNSLHHQGIRALAPCLRPMALSEDGLIEAWYLPGASQWLWGVQWHPEMLEEDPAQQAIFRAFLDACAGKISWD